MTKDVEILYTDVYSRCQRLSSFEGRDAIQAGGDSDYERVHITGQDITLVNDYTSEAIRVISGLLDDRLVTHLISETGVKMTIATNSSRIDTTSLGSQITELVVSYTMRQWLQERKPARVEFYQTQFADLLSALMDLLYQQDAPAKHRREIKKYRSTIIVEEGE